MLIVKYDGFYIVLLLLVKQIIWTLDIFHGSLRSILQLLFIFCSGIILFFGSHQCYTLQPLTVHKEIKPLKLYSDNPGKCHIRLNGLYGGEAWNLQPFHSTAQCFEENQCRNSRWSQTVPTSAVHPAAVYSQRWTQATFWKELCSCTPWQQASIYL